MSKYSSQSGAAFLYILIAIALIALLSAAMSRGSRTNQTILTNDAAKISAQDVMDYGNKLAAATQKLRLRGCTETQFDFANSAWTLVNGSLIHAPGHNPTSASGCAVFNPAQGGISAIVFPYNYTSQESGMTATWTALGHGKIIERRMPGIGDETKEDVIYHLARLDMKLCQHINKLLGIAELTDDPPTNTHVGVNSYDGDFPDTSTFTQTGGPSLIGRTEFCAKNMTDVPNQYSYYKILLIR